MGKPRRASSKSNGPGEVQFDPLSAMQDERRMRLLDGVTAPTDTELDIMMVGAIKTGLVKYPSNDPIVARHQERIMKLHATGELR